MSAVIFNGDAVKALKDKLRFKSGTVIHTGSVNPSSTATSGNAGDVYLSTATNKMYVKQDSGSSTNWSEVVNTAALASYIPTSEKGALNGVATLDGGGKVPVTQLPSTLMDYKGTWDASTNTPTLANGTGNQGDVYITSVAGTVNFGAGPITFAVGDWAIYNGSIWEKSLNSNAVVSVNGYTGTVSLNATDVGAANTTLSNLTSPTAINQDLLPSGDLTKDLGSPSARFAEGYVEKILAPDGQTGITVVNGAVGINDSNGNPLLVVQEGPTLSYSFVDINLTDHGLYQLKTADSQQSAVNKDYVDRADNNYIINSNALNSTSGWATYADAAGTQPVDGTGGTANITWTRTLSSPLRNPSTFLFTKDAANRQGQGVSFEFLTDIADMGKVLQGSFDYAIASGTYADGDISVWVYDITNAKRIPCVPSTLKNHSMPAEKFFFEFQTSINSTNYRLLIHTSGTSASAYTLKFNNFRVGPQAKLYGSPVTGWVSYTPTGSFTTNTTYTGKWRQVGDSMEVQVKLAFAGAPNSTNLTLDLPSGYSIDTNKIVSTNSDNLIFGQGTILDAGTKGYPINVDYNNSTSVRVIVQGANETSLFNSGYVSNTGPFTIGAGDSLAVTFKVPIQGWSSSQIMSHDANTRVVAVGAYGGVTSGTDNTFEKIVGFTVDPWSDDTHGMLNVGLSRFDIKVTGSYDMYASGWFATNGGAGAASNRINIRINGVDAGPIALVDTTAAQNQAVSCFLSGTKQNIKLKAGDYVEFWSYQYSTTNRAFTGLSFSLTKNNGPSQIMASENVTCRYKTSAGQSISNGGVVEVLFGTKDWDSHNCYNTSTGRFSPPISGEYEISSKVLFTSGGGWSVGEVAQMILKKNTVDTITMDFYSVDANNTNYRNLNGISRIMLLPTDNISIAVFQNTGGAISLEASAAQNYIEIRRVGNYA